MLVVVVPVVGMTVPVVGVIDVVTVRDRRVPAVRPVDMNMARVSKVGERVLVIVPVMRSVSMTFVDVVSVAFAFGACVTTARSVFMLRVGVDVMFGGCHGSSLL